MADIVKENLARKAEIRLWQGGKSYLNTTYSTCINCSWTGGVECIHFTRTCTYKLKDPKYMKSLHEINWHLHFSTVNVIVNKLYTV